MATQMNNDIESIIKAVYSLKYGTRDSAAYALNYVTKNSKSRKCRELALALIGLHKLSPEIETMLAEREEWNNHINSIGA
jgi:hypothetical protein